MFNRKSKILREIYVGVGILLVGSACSAQMVYEGYPSNGSPKNGIVKYTIDVLDSVNRARREDAEEKMKAFCDPQPYRIVEKTVKPKADFFATTTGNSIQISQSSEEFMYIKFECVSATSNPSGVDL
jgi:hypothetical protein